MRWCYFEGAAGLWGWRPVEVVRTIERGRHYGKKVVRVFCVTDKFIGRREVMVSPDWLTEEKDNC